MSSTKNGSYHFKNLRKAKITPPKRKHFETQVRSDTSSLLLDTLTRKNPIFIKIITHCGHPMHQKIIIQSYEDLIRCVSNPRWFSETRNFESRKLVEFIRKYLKIFESDPDILLAPSLYPSQSLESQKSFRKSCKNFRICIWVENNYSKYPRYIIYRIKQHFTKDQIKIETNSGNFKGIIVIKILELLQFQSPQLLKHFTKRT